MRLGESTFDDALRFASMAHEAQTRDHSPLVPYICHPIEVFLSLAEIGKVRDEIVLTASLLHDVLEESAVSEDQIKDEFGDQVLKLVLELTRTEPSLEVALSLSKKELYSVRTSLLLNDLKHIGNEAHQIKLADRLSNLNHVLIYGKKPKRKRYLEQTKLILEVIPKSCEPRLWQALNDLVHCEKAAHIKSLDELRMDFRQVVSRLRPSIG